MRLRKWANVLAAAGLMLTAGGAAQAQTTIAGGSTLLSQAGANQIATWLGEGPLTLTRIYAKSAGDTASTFHAAVDGKGRTFTVLEATAGEGTRLIGGYNPQSWNSTGTYNHTPADADRTAFLFNLTLGLKQNQKLSSDPNGWDGKYQTFNHAGYGPTFSADLTLENLDAGHVQPYTYGPGVYPNGPNIYGTTNDGELERFAVGALEVFTIGPASEASVVPEPGSLLLFVPALAVVGVLRRRTRGGPGAVA